MPLAQTLSFQVAKNQKNWDDLIPAVLFAYRTSMHSTLQETPFFLMHGRDARIPCDVRIMPPTQLAPDVHLYVEETVIKLQLAKDLAKQNMARVQFRVEGCNP